MNDIDSGIYSITSKINGKRYIGSTIMIHKRWLKHLNILKQNKHHSKHLQNHYNKYGKDDLVFTVLEVVEKNDLTLEEHRQQLLKIEQAYLDNWNECHFNGSKLAGSTLGYKKSKSKYYYYNSRDKSYQTSYNVQGKRVPFTHHSKEEDAIKEIEYIKTLTEQELLDYKKECLARPHKKARAAKNYCFIKSINKWAVVFYIKSERKFFGNYSTKDEAIEKVKEVKLELGI